MIVFHVEKSICIFSDPSHLVLIGRNYVHVELPKLGLPDKLLYYILLYFLQICEINESPIFMKLNPLVRKSDVSMKKLINNFMNIKNINITWDLNVDPIPIAFDL